MHREICEACNGRGVVETGNFDDLASCSNCLGKGYYEVLMETDIGDTVQCDGCGDMFPAGDTRSGGYLFTSKAFGPCCGDNMMKNIKKYKEEHYIKAVCPESMTFRQFVINLRDGNNIVRVTRL